MAQIDKQFGTGAIMRFGAALPGRAIETIPTGSIALDLALGVGGIPRGRIIEVFGPESSGKTTLCQHILAEAQKLGGTVAYIDVEHALDLQYGRACGLTIEEMLISQPDTGEQALQIVDLLVRSGGLDAIVVDSVAALVPRAEIEGEMGDSHVWRQGREGRDLLYGTPLEERTAGAPIRPTSIFNCQFTRDNRGLVFATGLFEDTYGLGYLALDDPSAVRPVTVTGTVHTGRGELTHLERLRDARYRVDYNIGGCTQRCRRSWPGTERIGFDAPPV